MVCSQQSRILAILAALPVLALASRSFALGSYDWNGTNSSAWSDGTSWYPGSPGSGGTVAAPIGGNTYLGNGATTEPFSLVYDPTNDTGITNPTTYIAGGLYVGHSSAAEIDVLSGNLTFLSTQYGGSNVGWDGKTGTLDVSNASVTFDGGTGNASVLVVGKAGTNTGLINVTNHGTLNINGSLTFNYEYGNNTLTVGQGSVVNVNGTGGTTPTAGTTTLNFGSHIVLEGNGVFAQTQSGSMTFYNHNAAANNSFVAFQNGSQGTLSLFDGVAGANQSTVSSMISADVTSGQFDILNGAAFTPITSVSQLLETQSGNQLLVQLAAAPTPEPATLALFGIGFAGLLLAGRRRSRVSA